MTADALRLVLGDDLTIEVLVAEPMTAQYREDHVVYEVRVRPEELLGALGVQLDPRGAPVATETPEEPTGGETETMPAPREDYLVLQHPNGGDAIRLALRPGSFVIERHDDPVEEDNPTRGWFPQVTHTLRAEIDPRRFERIAEALDHRPVESEDHPAVAWWLADAREVAEATMPKAVEYGSTELIETGRVLADQMGMGSVSDQEAMEVTIYAYMLGKMGRWSSAIKRGARVSDDTILDLQVYATMIRKIRQTGEWA